MGLDCCCKWRCVELRYVLRHAALGGAAHGVIFTAVSRNVSRCVLRSGVVYDSIAFMASSLCVCSSSV